MSLQSKVIGLILAVFMGYGAFDYAVQRLFILPSFQALEREEALKDMDRAMQTIEREAQHLMVSTADWATWDETYHYVQDRNDTYREANLNAEALKSLKVNLLYIYNAVREPVWGMIYDVQAHEVISLAAFPTTALPEDHPLVSLPETRSRAQGLLLTERGPLLVAAKPVITSAAAGPVRGAVVLGQFLDAAAIAQQARVQLTVSILKKAGLQPEEAAIAAELGSGDRSILREDENIARVYRILPDLFGQPALLLRVDVPKAISARGQGAVRYALLSLLGAGLVILFVLVASLRYLVLGPIRRLTGHAVAIGQRGDLTARLSLNRRDELGVLAREFDQMVERLAAARKALVEQSHQSGIAEMASGVLHNIGNAVTPLKVRVANLESALREAPTAELHRALTELADPNTPPDRRGDLEQFVDLAGREIAAVLETTAGQLAGVAYQVEHVQKILSGQERFSRAARVLEPVPVAELARESVDLLGDDLRREFQVELDASLTAASAVLGSRVALQQILVNLLKNAAEAIRERSPPPGTGRIAVDARTESTEGGARVHLRVTDNGVGIPPETMSRLFERGFSTKSRPSSGLGLHWCAVTAAALGGQLQAESAGRGQGACLHLRLPQAGLQPAPRAAATER
jgi:sensor domain CHASE-containing protein